MNTEKQWLAVGVLGGFQEPPHRSERKNWKRTWRLLGKYFTISSCPVKMRLSRHTSTGRMERDIREMRRKMWQQQDGVCPMCGKAFPFKTMEAHHILPWARFPELRRKRENLLLVCHDCHKWIHINPWLQIRMMEEKARELGIDLNERYGSRTMKDNEDL